MDKPQKLEENDHKKLGRELDLFVFSDLVGPGLPLWTPRGTVLRNELDRFVQEMRDEHGFQAITTPHITKRDLYERSGHWKKFSDELFKITSREKHEFALKPMNCPHHTQIYASRPRSYKELPIRYRETTMDYRDEQTGELNGILRPRAFTQDDAHVFCREDQIQGEVLKIWDIVSRFYDVVNLPLSVRLSMRDQGNLDAYAGKAKQWDYAESQLGEVLKKITSIDHRDDGAGEAAFYGPKLDFIAKDSLGREWQVATIQLDFAQPEGLDLGYIDEKGKTERPVMIHCAIMGSIERFLAVYIEHVGGNFPVWLAPEQLRVISLNDDKGVIHKCWEILDKAKELGLRVELDNANESVGKKIREAEVMKVPYTVVVGGKEVESGQVSPRVRSDLKLEKESFTVDEFLEKLSQDAKTRK